MTTTVRVDFTDWDPDKALAKVSARVLRGMDRACQFAAGVAEQMAPEKTGKLKAGITYEVVPVGNDIEGRIGQAKKGAFYERFQELGTKRMPARPHLRPAVLENGPTIIRLIEAG